MKTNEAPEKIYISPAGVLYKGDKQQNNDIEYIRKDSFIKKAYEYLNKTCRRFLLTEKDIEDFKNYMKGE